MKLNREIESFIKDFVKDLAENNVAIFAGAGMSKGAGYVDWRELLTEIAEDIGLNVKVEHDLISLAQYHVNEHGGGKAKIIRKILEEFAQDAETTENHKILARLPINTFWTTNYDTLIEESLKSANKVVDVKHQIKQLANTRPKRDVVVYKMHGDVHHPADAILTKEQYESYYKKNEHFITALSGDLISKTFLFIGFSFTDPNLDYVLSRLRIQFGENNRQHYCFIRRQSKGTDDEDVFQYNLRKQDLMINDLKRYSIKALVVDDYKDITEILKEIERRFRKKTVFISGSAEEYGAWNRNDAQGFIHSLSKGTVSAGFRIVNGFGWGIGSAVINGALEAVYEKPDKFSEDQLIMKPFPQFETGEKKLAELWHDYRQKMISLAGITVIIFGNKKDKNGNIIPADGVMKEFEIALSQELIPVPVAVTGYMSKDIFDLIKKDAANIYKGNEWIIPLVEELASDKLSPAQIINKVINIIQIINK